MKGLIVLLSLILTYNCAGTNGPNLNPDASNKELNLLPDWVLNPPSKDGYKYQSGTATSQDMQIALDKARLDASTTLSSMIESEWNGVYERAVEETGLESNSTILDNFKKTQQNIVSKQLNDLRVSKQDVKVLKTDDGKKIYRGYVLVEYDEMEAEKKLIQKIKADQALYDQMRATELFEEMEEKVQAYRSRK